MAPATVADVDRAVWSACVAAIRGDQWPIVIAGPTGTGKSCLAALIATRFPRWRWIETAELLSAFFAARTRESRTATMRTMAGQAVERSESEIVSWVDSAGILVLDDLGTRSYTEVQLDVLLTVINKRFRRPLICTTNLRTADFDSRLEARIASRLRAGTVIAYTGEDRRVRK